MRKTRRASKKGAVYPPMNIPELRRAFEHMEGWVLENHNKGAAAFQEEWQKTFRKPVDRASAEAYIEHVLSESKHATKGKKGSQKHRRQQQQQQQSGGMAAPLAGAPLDYTTRPGLYITPGVNQGSYAQVPAYVQSGFWNPEVAQLYDPVPGQTVYPTRTPLGMGSNLVGGSRKGKRRSKQNKQGGGSLMSSAMDSIHQLMFRPIPAMTPPPSVAMDAQSGMRGQTLGQSPDVTQTQLQYRMSPMPQTVAGAIPISAININRASLG